MVSIGAKIEKSNNETEWRVKDEPTHLIYDIWPICLMTKVTLQYIDTADWILFSRNGASSVGYPIKKNNLCPSLNQYQIYFLLLLKGYNFCPIKLDIWIWKKSSKETEPLSPQISTIIRMGRILEFMTYSPRPKVWKPRPKVTKLPVHRAQMRTQALWLLGQLKTLAHLVFTVTFILLFLGKSHWYGLFSPVFPG